MTSWLRSTRGCLPSSAFRKLLSGHGRGNVMNVNADKEKRTINCSSCTATNSEVDEFCHECGYPLSETATLGPPGIIQAQGFLFRKALSGRPKKVTLIGMWICFLPWVIVGVPAAIFLIVNGRGFEGFIFFWTLIALVCVAITILYRITRNYLTRPERHQGDVRPRHPNR